MHRMTARSVITALNQYKNKFRARSSARYFKSGIDKDIFIGVTVPQQRKIAKQFKDLPLDQVEILLKDKIHEYRLTGLLILTYKPLDKTVYDFYMSHTHAVNNWDLVDATAVPIVGKYLVDKNKIILEILSESKNIWERRIAIVATQYFIKQNDFQPTLHLSKKLLDDHHDLIHKALGWTLREMGKKNRGVLVAFVHQFAPRMPRTTLRYAIEHFSPAERKAIMRR